MVPMLAPLPHLKEGSIVDIVAPASACTVGELNKAIRFVKALGLKPRVSAKIFHGKTQIVAATDQERFGQLKKALLAKDSDAVWCIRGGYGSLRLLPELAKLKRPKKPKLFLGYSDITTLHMFLNGYWKWPTIHSPMVGRFGRGDNTKIELKEMKNILFGPGHSFHHALTPMNAAAKKSKIIRSAIVGGNIATLQGSMGTPWILKSDGRIILFEDLGEKPHRMDRMLMQMEQAGYFKRARAIIFGDVLFHHAPDERLIWNDVLPRFAASQKIPVFKGLKSGHGKVNRPIPFLTKAELKSGRRAALEISLTPV
jgi:muramoyltetrapeptide carboxypeptidase